jgi:hypothetical protein
MAIDIDREFPLTRASVTTRNAAALGWLAIFLLFALAVLLRHLVAANTDVSWLLIAGERVLDGKRLYRDIIETNPPMAVLTYIPGILVGRLLGISAETAVDGLVLTAIALSLAVTVRILRQSSVLDGIQGWPILILVVALLTVLPTETFAQREHIAVIELLPGIAVLAMRVRGEKPSRWMVVTAGLSLGLAMSFKPQFALALLCALCVIAVSVKSWRIFITPENVIAAVIIGAYVAATAIFFPEYFTVIGPLARDVYVPIGTPFEEMLMKPAVPLWGAASIASVALMRGKLRETAFLVVFALSIGFMTIFFLQRKGWPYHSYPMMLFAFLALGLGIGSWLQGLGRGNAVAIAAAFIAFMGLFIRTMSWFDYAFDARVLQAEVARFGHHQTIMAISGEGGMGHPLTRALGDTWGSREQNLWIAAHYRYLKKQGTPDPQTTAKLDAYAAVERQWLIADFHKAKPTIVLVDNLTDDWGGWLRSHPDVAGLLDNYRLAETFMGVDIMVRRTAE